jgi:hypothetical protein
MSRPIEPTREVVAFLARAEEGVPGGTIRAGVGLGGDVPRVYDPWLEPLEDPTPESLRAFCARARTAGSPGVLFYAYRGLNRKRFPDAFALLEDRAAFEPLARFDGIESEHVHYALRCREAAAGG